MLSRVVHNPFVASLFAGSFTAFAFPPFSFFPAALAGPVVCFYYWQHLTAKQTFFSAWLYSVALLSVGTPWIYFSALDLAAVGSLAGVLLGLVMIMALSLHFAVCGFIYKCLAVQCSSLVRIIFLFPACWGGGEYLQSTGVMGFPWLALGNSQLDSPLAGWITIWGVYGVSMLLAMVASLLVWGYQTRCFAVALLSIASILLSGIALQQINWTQPSGKLISIALMQFLLDDNGRNNQENWQTIIKQTELAWKNSDLVIWPESQVSLFAFASATEPKQELSKAVTTKKVEWKKSIVDLNGHTPESFWFLGFQENKLTQKLEKMANTNDKQILLGAVLTDNKGDLVHNSVLSLGAGKRAIYDKRHLAPFGEAYPYRPWSNWFWNWVRAYDDSISASRRTHPILPIIGGFNAGVSICYEASFGAEIAEALPEAGLLVMTSNDIMFTGFAGQEQHHQLARLRALETGRWVARVAATGVTSFIRPSGKEQSRLGNDVNAVLTGTVQPMKGITPYAYWKDTPVLVFMLLTLIYASITRFVFRNPHG